MTQDEQNLRVVSIFHYVVGGLAALFSMVPLIHLSLGLFIVCRPERLSSGGNTPPAFIGWILIVVAIAVIILGLIFAFLVILSGSFLARRKHYMFCLVMAGVECIFMPFGTALGVITIILLTREPVKQLFPPPTGVGG